MNEPVTALYSWPPIAQSLNMGEMEAGEAPKLYYIIHDIYSEAGLWWIDLPVFCIPGLKSIHPELLRLKTLSVRASTCTEYCSIKFQW